jgi:hypothetical protein
MQLTLMRQPSTQISTNGALDINDAFECYTLELPVIDGLADSAIPAGIYPVTLGPSPKFLASPDPWEQQMGQCIPHIDNVPNRSAIEIHWGNTASNTEGCVLVGITTGPDSVGYSRAAFTQLMLVLRSATDPIIISVQ